VRRGVHLSIVVLLSVVCLSVIVLSRKRGGPGPLAAVSPRWEWGRAERKIYLHSMSCHLYFTDDKGEFGVSHQYVPDIINRLKTKNRLLYLKAQFVPLCKHFSSWL
jgi:hypothetical protein